MTCIAWNSAAEHPFMFGTGSHDGAVRIWSTPSSLDTSPRDGSNPRTDPSSSRRREKTKQEENTPSPFDSPDPQNDTSSVARGSSRERTVAFSVPELTE